MFTLTGTLQDHGGRPLAGVTLTITPSPSVTVDRAGDVVHLGGHKVVTDEFGSFTVQLVTVDLGGGERPVYTVHTIGVRLRPVRFAAPEDGATVDLADVTPVAAPGPWAEYVKGDPGDPGGGTGGNGASAYEVAVDNGFEGSEQEWLDSLVGPEGPQGPQGDPGEAGPPGKSAYQHALDNGFVGSEADWLASLAGPQGPKGDKGDPGTDASIASTDNGNGTITLTGVTNG